ncbi:ABC transporter substrate-binding protein [Paenibacillus agaridevorans]|uniref:ABC transporter substrate-binding protein n=1 Tax=Paenibacillus agaridevorans TaxID=171404 RepID=UPI001BE3E925|nr:ABC transporter substrate-binding protein [Paenibacillus agaridevorans]
MRVKIAKTCLSIMLIVSMIALGACSSTNNGPNKSPSASATGTATTTDNPSATKKDPIELVFFYPVAVGGSMREVFDNLATQFNEEHGPDITVKNVYSGSYQDTLVKVKTGVMGKDSPDLTLLSSTALFELLDMDAIMPIDDLIAKDGGDDYINDFYEAFLANGRTNGQLYSIPFQRSTIILYYNKDLFRKAGLDPEKPPTTYAELVEYGKALTNKETWGLEITATDFIQWMFQAFALQNGKNIMNQDGTEVYLDTPENIEVLQFWKDLVFKHKIMPTGATAWGTIPTDFISQKTAMMYHTTGNLGTVQKGATFDFGTAFLPAGKQYGTPVGGANLYIIKGLSQERQDAAWKFIRWLTEPERMAQFSIETGYVAATKSSYETDVMKKFTAEFPQFLTARDQLEYASSSFSVHNQGEIAKVFMAELQAAIVSNADPAESLKKIQKAADEALKQYHK